MDLFATCITCSQTKGMPLLNQFTASYFEDQTARVKCSHGHEMAIVVRAPKFELLLESGANALNLDFTLEASASYSTALERFFEFAIKVILKRRNMKNSVYEAMFKTMSRQSERQVGAFFVLHALIFREAYQPNKKLTEFRNAVIHKGTIPSPEEARKFCGLVYIEIYKVSKLLNSWCKSEINMVLDEEYVARASKVPDNIRVHSSQKSSIFNILGDNNKSTFEDALANFNSFNKTLEKAAKDMSMITKVINSTPELQKQLETLKTME